MPPTQAKRRINIVGLLKPYQRSLWLSLLAMAGEAVADVLQPWPLKIVLDNVFGVKSKHGWLNDFIDVHFGRAPMRILLFAVVAVLLIAVFDAACSYADKYLTTSVGQWVTHDLRRAIYSQVQRLSLAFHDTSQTGDLISRVTVDIDAIQSFIVNGLLTIVVNILTLVLMIGVMLHLNWRFTLIALAVVPPLTAVVYTYTRKVKKASRDVRKHEGKLTSVVQEVLSSIRVVKAFAREDYELDRLEHESLETVESALAARALKARLTPIVNILIGIGTAAVFWFGVRMVLANELSVGSLIVFLAYLRNMYKPIQELSKIMDTYSKADIGYERIQEIMGSENEMRDHPKARRAPRFHGKIDLDKVSFSYTPDQPVLQQVSLHVTPGQMVALVGPTGSGKTTIINLIARFYDPSSGTVRIDNHDIKLLKQASLRSQISFVLQDTVLFTGTIWQNIAYGRPEASRAEILAAAHDSNADEFIAKLPKGYDTPVGERGLTLSGGQRQRIAIARAIVRNSPILILDEPTSGLDAASEQLVFSAIDRLIEGKTAIVIAHRLSTVRRANCIYVIRDGHVEESGSHEQLLAAQGAYANLYHIQFTEPEPANPLLA